MMVYADNNATALVAAAHYDAVVDVLRRVDGNPSSIHAEGREAKVALEDARAAVAKLFSARPSEIIFASGATEANNIVVQGVVQKMRREMAMPHVIVSAIEHSAVLEPALLMAERGLCLVSVLPVDCTGRVQPADLKAAMRSETALVCIMHANNEIGTIQNVYELADIVKTAGPHIHFHTDAVQMLGKADLRSYGASKIDSAVVSCHKVGGFKGVGALYLRSGIKLSPMVAGGGQERGRRPGTENLPGIISFGLIAKEMIGQERLFIDATEKLRQSWLSILDSISGVVVAGDRENTLSNTVNFHIEGVPGEDVLLNFDLAGIRASSGSACSSGVGRPSHVLKALGYDDVAALNSIRVSFHPGVTEEGIAHMGRVLKQTVARVRG